jgi:hypothetical protein
MSTHIDELRQLVEGSHVGLVIWTEHYGKDHKSLLELGAILVADKPMYMLVKRGVFLPERLRYIAVDIEFYDGKKDFNTAAARLISRLRERLDKESHGTPA